MPIIVEFQKRIYKDLIYKIFFKNKKILWLPKTLKMKIEGI